LAQALGKSCLFSVIEIHCHLSLTMMMGIRIGSLIVVFDLFSGGRVDGGRVDVGGVQSVLTRMNATGSVESDSPAEGMKPLRLMFDMVSVTHETGVKLHGYSQIGDEADQRSFSISERMATGGTRIKLMTLNVEFFTETCDKGLTKGNDYCLTTQDATCELDVTQMLCCNAPQPKLQELRDACRVRGCFDVGDPDVEDPSSGIWKAYLNESGTVKLPGHDVPIKESLDFLSEPRCLQGARNLLQQVVLQHNPHVVATQEDFENYPLMVPGYVTIISANSHPMWYRGKSGGTLKLMDKKKKTVHMVNALLVRDEVFNKEETKKLCSGSGYVYEEFTERFFRCGLDLRSEEAEAKKNELLNVSVEGPPEHKLYGWENDISSGKTKPRPMPDDADSILLMASRCAALAVVNVGSAVENIAVASAHLTGGRFDDDLIGLPEAHRVYEEIQKVEKIKQVNKLAAALTASGHKSIIMGDFNGPDDFDIQWWKVLTAPWPATHPFLGSLFGGKEGNEQVLGPIRKEFAGDNADLSKLHTSGDDGLREDSYWRTKTLLPNDKITSLARFEEVYKEWMVGMHLALREQGWMPLATSQDFTQSFGKVRGTTSKFGGMIDFFYASPGFVGNLSCKLPTPDFSAGADFSDGEIDQLARVKECPKVRDNEKPGIVAMNLDVVKGVLKRSTDHAPVLAEIMIDR